MSLEQGHDDLARSGRTMAVPFRAPRTPFNDAVTRKGTVAYTELDLEGIKKVKNRFNVTVNDVVMALCSSVLRRFLLDRGQLPDTSLVATVPVSVHDKSDRPGRNQLSALFTRLETQIADPAERLRAIERVNSVAKEHSSAIGATLLLDWAQFGARALLAPALRLYTSTRSPNACLVDAMSLVAGAGVATWWSWTISLHDVSWSCCNGVTIFTRTTQGDDG